MDTQKTGTDPDLYESERRYQDLYDSAPIAYFTVNAAEGQILNCNKAAQRLLGYSRKAMLQMKVFELYADTFHGLPKAQKVFKDFKAGKSVRNIELQVKQHSGRLIWVSLSVEPEMDLNGKTVRSRSMMVDISDRKAAEIALHEMCSGVQDLVDKRTAELAEINARLKQEIEERKKAESALRANAKTLHTLINATTNLVVLLDAAGNVLAANERACKRFGKTLREFKGENIYSCMPPELAKSRKKIADTVIHTREPGYHFEEIEGKFYNTIVYPILDDKFIVGSYAVSIQDVTLLKLAERDLRQSEKKFRMLVEKMNDGLAVQDENGVWTYVNDRFCSMLGYPREEVIGRAVFEFLDAGNRKIFKKQMVGRKKGHRGAYEIEWLHKRKGNIATIVSPQPVLDEAGNFKGAFAVITDISSQKQAQAALRESEKNFKTLAENANDGIILFDMDGKIVYANSWFEKVTGYSGSGIMKGRGTTRLADEAINEIHLQKLRKRLAVEPGPDRYETEIITKAGRSVPVEFTLSKTIWHGHAVILLIVRDITSQKETEHKLLREQMKLEDRVRQRTKELLETNKALFVLARNIDKKRKKVQENTSRIVNSKIMPKIEGFQKNKTFTDYRMEFDVLKAYLNELTHNAKDEPAVAFILSTAELRVATMIKKGFTSPQIARSLSVSPDTVKTHRKNIRKKLNIHNSKINLETYLRAKLK